MKKVYLILLICFALFRIANAQSDIVIGTGTAGNTASTYPAPLQDFYEGCRMQYLYLASELTAAGMGPGIITGLKYEVTALNATLIAEQMKIGIDGTSTASLGTTTWETVTNYVFGPIDFQPLLGFNTFTFSTPYVWNGSDNIVVEVCNGDPNNASAVTYTNNPTTPWTTGLTFNGSHNYRADGLGNLCGTTTTANTGLQNSRPNITFQWTASANCSGVPVAGVAASSDTSVCGSQNFLLSLTGSTIANGISVRWQSSSDNVVFTDIAGGAVRNLTTSQLATAYYRAVVKCISDSSFSNTVKVSSPLFIPANTYTINSAAATGGTNFASFGDAINFIKCGISGPIVFNVVSGSGPYNEQVSIPAITGTSATNTISFNGNGETVAFSSVDANNRYIFQLNGADYVFVRNLTIDASVVGGTYGWGIHLTNNATYDSIVNCTILTDVASTSTNYCGVVISGSNISATQTDNSANNIVIMGNTISGGYYSIVNSGSLAAPAVENVRILNNIITDFYTYAVYLNGTANNIVSRNIISRPNRTNSGTAAGVYMNTLNSGALVEGNKITNMFDAFNSSTSTFYGFYIPADGSPTAPNRYINNLVSDINHNGTIYGIYNTGAANMIAYHNTFSLDNTNATAGATYGFYQITSDTGMIFENNIITITRGGSGAKFGIYKATATTPLICNYNSVFLNSAGTGTQAFGYQVTNQATLAAWQAISGHDLNSQSVDPLYQSIGSDYTPTFPSLNDKGTPVGVPIDLIGAPRSSVKPDIGAYEFTVPTCTTPPTAGDATAVSTAVCVNGSIALSLINNSAGLTQTYQWETSATGAAPWTPIGNVLSSPDTNVVATTSLFYRSSVTCGSSTTYSTSVQIIVSPAFAAGSYTINSALPPSATNFQSFNEAITALKCGITGPVVFNIDANSSFSEQVTIPVIPGTSSTNRVTFNGNGASLTYGSSDANVRHVIQLFGADYITIRNLNIIATGGTYGWGIHLTNQADNDSIVNCTIVTDATSTLSNYAGIVISGSNTSATTSGNNANNTVIAGNTITGGYYGITNYGNFAAPFTNNNKFVDNTLNDMYYYGIYTYGSTNSLISGNIIQRPGRSIVGFTYGIYMSGIGFGSVIEKNRIRNMFDLATSSTSTIYSIYLTSDATITDPISVINNVVSEINHNGSVYGIYNAGARYSKFYHNSITINNTNATAGVTYGYYQSSTDTGTIVKNNIININRGGTGDKYGMYLGFTPDTLLTCNYNNVYLNSPSGNQSYGYATLAYATLTDWQAATTYDDNSLSVDPVFVANGPDYVPTNGILNDRGTTVGVAIDVTGATRSISTPDIGAFEFSVAVCTSPPTAGDATANNSSICAGNPVLLSLLNNSYGLTQTYRWESSASSTGPWTPIGNVLPFPDSTVNPTITTYYRAAVTCGTSTTFSTPVMVTVKPALTAGNYTINAALPTSGYNFQSFLDATQAFECGVTGPVVINIAPGSGPYSEQVILKKISGTSATNNITFNGNGASLVYTATDPSNRAAIKLDGADFITFKNLNIDVTSGSYGWGILMTNQADNDSILNCTIITDANSTLSNYAGIVISGNVSSATTGGNNANNAVIMGNTITGGYYGIINYGNFAIPYTDNNKIVNNTINDFYYYGIYTYGSTNPLVSGNIVQRPNRTVVTTAYGIYASSGTTGALIEKNKVQNLFSAATSSTATSYCIYLSSDATATTSNNIVNNLISDINHEGTIYGIYNAGSRYSNMYHNTISLDNAAATAGATYGYYQSSSDTSIRFMNNLITIARGGSGSKYSLYLSSSVAPLPVSNYNNIYLNSAGTGILNVGYLGNAYLTLADWKTGTNQDNNSFSFDPLYTNAASNDYKPTQATLDNLGIPVGVLTDLNNVSRSIANPDMGAYEFGQPIPVTLKSISATIVSKDVSVKWSTASELNCSHFEVDRSFNGRDFEKAGIVQAIQSGTAYQFMDKEIVSRSNADLVIYYRLKMVDKDGRFTWSPVVSVRISKTYKLVAIYPNPVKRYINIMIQSPSNDNLTLIITDLAGKVVNKRIVNVMAGDNKFNFNLETLSAGTYIMKAICANGCEAAVQKFVKQ